MTRTIWSGIATAALLTLAVAPSAQATIDYGILYYPPSLVAEGGDATSVFGQVFDAGVTESLGAPGGITAQIGFGAQGTDPTIDLGWSWTAATWNAQLGSNDEFVGSLIINTMGDYAYTYRFTDDGGATYLYADLTGSQDGFQSGSLGSATILSSTPEPATALLLAFGLAGSAWVDRRRSR